MKTFLFAILIISSVNGVMLSQALPSLSSNGNIPPHQIKNLQITPANFLFIRLSWETNSEEDIDYVLKEMRDVIRNSKHIVKFVPCR